MQTAKPSSTTATLESHERLDRERKRRRADSAEIKLAPFATNLFLATIKNPHPRLESALNE